MRHLFRGIRSGLALFQTSPSSAIAAVVALALGLGFSTTMFGIVHGATRMLPVDEPEQIIALTKVAHGPNAGESASRGLDLVTWRRAAANLADLEAFQTASFNISSDQAGAPERVNGTWITPGSFDRLGARAALGRTFIPEDAVPGATAAVLISHTLWTSRFAGGNISGQIIRLDGMPYTIVGVMPAGFGFPIRSDVWLPFEPDAANQMVLQVWGRLSASTGRDSLAAAMSTATARLAEQHPATHARIGVQVIPFTELETPREVIAGLYVLLLAVSGVLIIACVNVANLFLARAAARARDTAVRLALGANRRILLLEQTGEVLALTAIACAAGVTMAYGGTAVFAANTAHIIEAYWVSFTVDRIVLAWAAGLAAAAALLAAILPAWRASRADVVQTLRDGAGATSRRASRTSRVLVTAQIACACALLALTLLLGRSALSLQQKPWPFDAGAIWSTNVSIPLATMDDAGQRERLLSALTREIESLPGGHAALANVQPGRSAGNWQFSLDGPADRPTGTTSFTIVSSQYFATLGASAARGRLIDEADRRGSPLVAVVNDSWVRRFSADRDPLGRQVTIGPRVMTIVGVVPDLMPADIQDARQDGVYGAMAQLRPYGVRVLASGAITPRMLRDAVDRVDPDLPLYETFTVLDAAMRDKQVLNVLSGLFGLFGTGALTLTAIGLYSVMALLVALRTREFGIRLALGATRRDLFTLVAGQGGRQVITGLAVGIVLGVALATIFANAVEALTVNYTGLIAGITAALLTTSALALVVPTWTATRVNPVTALKAD